MIEFDESDRALDPIVEGARLFDNQTKADGLFCAGGRDRTSLVRHWYRNAPREGCIKNALSKITGLCVQLSKDHRQVRSLARSTLSYRMHWPRNVDAYDRTCGL